MLLTGGTLARAAAEGHRVIIVVATSGDQGLTGAGWERDLETRRLRELEASAALLGVSQVRCLGYGDSGMNPQVRPPAGSFCAAPPGEAAARLAEVLRAERADVLTIYDGNGGYGHRDHVRVHQVGLAAAAAAGTAVVLEATVERERLTSAMRLLNRFGVRPGGWTTGDMQAAFRSRTEITHEVDVRSYTGRKRAAMAAHASQAVGGDDIRTLRLLAALPRPVFRRVLGREWFVEVDRTVPARPLDDIFATLR